MATTVSAGILLYRTPPEGLQLLLAHPGGPYWLRRDDGAWTLPKGEVDPGEDPLAAALREFGEETGFEAHPPYLPLGEVRMKSGKRVLGWAARGDADPQALRSNVFELEWPPKSGRLQRFPEIDRAAWFTPEEALRKLLPAQADFVVRLQNLL